MKRYRVTLRVYERADLLRGIELPDGLALRGANFYTERGPEYAPAATKEFVELVCVEDVGGSR